MARRCNLNPVTDLDEVRTKSTNMGLLGFFGSEHLSVVVNSFHYSCCSGLLHGFALSKFLEIFT